MSRSSLLLLVVLLLPGCSTAPGNRAFPDATALPARASMPDPLVMLDGRRVTERSQWFKERRPELRALFEHYMYGSLPSAPGRTRATVLGQYPDFLEGKATLKLVSLEVAPPRSGPGVSATNAPRIDLMLVVPSQRVGPAPVFLAMDFCGNQALTSDPRVPLAHSWMPGSCKGCLENRASEASRGRQTTNWPLAEIVRRGYALAVFYSGDVDPDSKEANEGIWAWLAATEGAGSMTTGADRGTLAAWAWGFERCVDYLVQDSDIDAKRIAAVGHSRNGKATLLAAAFDDRIAIAFPHQAGTGGSAPSRGKTGESLKAINDLAPYWFNAQFKKFNGAPERLPFDQNCLVALCAPRPVLFTAAQEDQWANPAGQFEVLRAADPVYRLLGSEGLAARQMPALRTLVDSPLGFWEREGKHSMLPDDWRVFMDFADKQFGGLTHTAAPR